MDVLSDVLKTARVSGGVFLSADMRAPFCLNVEASPQTCIPYLGATTRVVPYHLLVEGCAAIKIEGGQLIEISAGDVILFPHNRRHLVASDPELSPTGADEVIRPSEGGGLSSIEIEGPGERTRMVCGFLGGDFDERNPLFAGLPDALVLGTADSGAAEWIRSTLHFAVNELNAGVPGVQTVLAKLSELLFVEAIRRYIDELPPQSAGWLAGLSDPYLSTALTALHSSVAKAWTLDDLGAQVGLSRSALVDRFTRVIGVAPMQYLQRWRMQVAAHELTTGQRPLAQVAADVGYESEAAFSRAFRKSFGLPPATWRRRRPSS